jgi:8-oxo-dGTP diphosphatase
MQPNVATLPITVGVGAYLARGRELLVVRKTYGPSKGQWTIPSGYVERHESIVATVEREVKEETNIVGRAGPVLAVRNRVTEEGNDTFVIFRVAYLAGEPQPDRVEVSEAAFVPLADLEKSREAAAFTRAIVPKLADAEGLYPDPYQPPVERGGPIAYHLYLAAAKAFSRPAISSPHVRGDPGTVPGDEVRPRRRGPGSNPPRAP